MQVALDKKALDIFLPSGAYARDPRILPRGVPSMAPTWLLNHALE